MKTISPSMFLDEVAPAEIYLVCIVMNILFITYKIIYTRKCSKLTQFVLFFVLFYLLTAFYTTTKGLYVPYYLDLLGQFVLFGLLYSFLSALEREGSYKDRVGGHTITNIFNSITGKK